MLRTGLLITVLLAKNWSDDRTLLSNSHSGPPAPPNTRNPLHATLNTVKPHFEAVFEFIFNLSRLDVLA